ncbi:MAG: hypothetical protein ABSB49_13580 [Polyangia bacterium]
MGSLEVVWAAANRPVLCAADLAADVGAAAWKDFTSYALARGLPYTITASLRQGRCPSDRPAVAS